MKRKVITLSMKHNPHTWLMKYELDGKPVRIAGPLAGKGKRSVVAKGKAGEIPARKRPSASVLGLMVSGMPVGLVVSRDAKNSDDEE